MSVFTDNELEYLAGQRLGRLATVDPHGNPHVVPVGFRYNPDSDTIDIGGLDLKNTAKWRHASAHARVAFVVDDVLPPWQARGLEVRGEVELVEKGGKEWGRISPPNSCVCARHASFRGGSTPAGATAGMSRSSTQHRANAKAR